MKRGFMYRMAMIDLHSRYVVGWSVSNSMEAEGAPRFWKKQSPRMANQTYLIPIRADEFTSDVFIKTLKDKQITISMDGKGRALDNIFIERLWRSFKYENIYLNAYADGASLYQGLKTYFDFFNHRRFHQNLTYQTP